jgi:hypothetical protein
MRVVVDSMSSAVIVPKSEEWDNIPFTPKFRFSSATMHALQPREMSFVAAAAAAPSMSSSTGQVLVTAAARSNDVVVTTAPHNTNHPDMSEYERQMLQFRPVGKA